MENLLPGTMAVIACNGSETQPCATSRRAKLKIYSTAGKYKLWGNHITYPHFQPAGKLTLECNDHVDNKDGRHALVKVCAVRIVGLMRGQRL